MSSEDVYSNKDSNHNRMLEERQSKRTIAIVILCAAIMSIIFLYHYYHYANVAVEPVVQTHSEPPAIVSDMAHPYDDTRPPSKQ